jgi:hypothetical protein
MTEKDKIIRELQGIPGVGVSIAGDLYNIGIRSVASLKGKDPEELYSLSNQYAGLIQDRCLLYVFRCAVYFATEPFPEIEKLKWWNWKGIELKRTRRNRNA